MDADSIGADRGIRPPKVPLGDRVARPVSTSCKKSIRPDRDGSLHRCKIEVYQHICKPLWRKFLNKFGYLVRRNTTILNERLEIVCRGGFGILPYRINSSHKNLCVITSWRAGEQGCGTGLSSGYGNLELDTTFFQVSRSKVNQHPHLLQY